MSATCVGIRAPLALRARANGGVKGSRTVRVLAKASAAEDVKGCKVGLAALAVRLPTVRPEDAPTTYPTSIRARLQPPRLTHTLPHPRYPTPQAAPATLLAQASAAAESTDVQNAAIAAHQALWDLGVADDPLDPDQAKELAGFLGPLFSVTTLLFIIRIVMTWYPSVPVSRFPWVVAYLPTEPLLKPTRSLVPPVGGVDVSPIIWVGMISFMNEILLGKQGLLVLLSAKQAF